MRRCLLLPAVYAVDQVAGDPEWFPHPVRVMGLGISRGESFLRGLGDGNAFLLASGGLLTLTVVASSYFATAAAIRVAGVVSPALGGVVELGLGWTCLAARSLSLEAAAVMRALEVGDLVVARGRLARIVGRDTERLYEAEISRAVIETVAESACDGIVAPLFFMALGGVPLAMAYKAVNTLDSMIGHADARYFDFGKAAARLDDAANYLPARLTALLIVAAAGLTRGHDARAAWRTWLRDGGKHKSPNAGRPESAMAGALRVRLGGDNTYSGEVVCAERMGDEFPAPGSEQARGAIRVVSVVALLAVGACLALTAFRRKRVCL